jgi:hypothetical protein
MAHTPNLAYAERSVKKYIAAFLIALSGCGGGGDD